MRSLISIQKYLSFQFEEPETIKNITGHVEMVLGESKIKEGFVLVSAFSTTASIFINDDEEGLLQDTLEYLDSIVPKYKAPPYRHNKSEKDAPAHLKADILGRSEMISVTNGKLDLGNWEQIFYADFNGMRKKKICVKIMGE
ncbi:YjbQ family protein [Dorea sp. OM02-2LB]|nr:YjbQ family protein [Dorea sp. OM02-2LB]